MGRFHGMAITGPRDGQLIYHFSKVVQLPILADAVLVGSGSVCPDKKPKIEHFTYEWSEGIRYPGDRGQMLSGPLWLPQGWTVAQAVAHLYNSYSRSATERGADRRLLEEIADIIANDETGSELISIASVLATNGFKT